MQTKFVTDQLHRTIEIPIFPQRIVSLVPSQTELLADLQLDARVVGITKFCIHPAQWFRTKTRVGGTKTLHLDTITALRPDLIIANKEENTQAEIEALAQTFPVWISDIYTLNDACDMITRIGALLDEPTHQRAQRIATSIQQQFQQLRTIAPTRPLRVAYFIWQNPMMVAASDTFIDHILNEAGFVNAFAALSRYPSISEADLQAARPDLVFLSSEPYPFGEKHITEFQQRCPLARVLIVDGELFSWYGSRLLHSAHYLHTLRQQLASL